MPEINLALNTIVYISIFIFPGIIFRKFLFIGKDSKQFYFGNLFERFIWTLFFSLLSLLLSAIIFYFLRYELKVIVLESISYNTIENLHKQLSANTIPNKKILKGIWKHFLILIFAIYTISAILGFVLGGISNRMKNLKLIKFNNYWHDLFNNNDFNDDDKFAFGYTNADILIETNEGSKMYSGIISDYYIDMNFKLQTIILENTKRYKKSKDDFEIKLVPGHNFIIDYEKVLNINLNYIYQKKEELRFYKKIKNYVSAFFLFLAIVLIVFSIAIKLPGLELSWIRRGVLIFQGISLINVLDSLTKCIVTRQLSKINFSIIFNLLISIVVILWIFKLISGLLMIIISIILVVVISLLMTKKQKS